MQPLPPKAQRANRRIVVACLAMVVAMTGMAYAAVPLYQLFCQVTGYGGTTQRSELLSDTPVLDRQIVVRFDANIAGDINWDFKPVERKVAINLGEQKQISFTAENLSNETITGTATFNVTPQYAGVYFNKIECFCFTETTLKPGEKIDMPVVFFIDPDLDNEEVLNNLKTITLSYTMFREDDEETPVAAVKGSADRKTFN